MTMNNQPSLVRRMGTLIAIIVIMQMSISCVSVSRGRGREAMEAATIERVVFETNCPKSDVSTQWLGDKELGIQACGQKAVYVMIGIGCGMAWTTGQLKKHCSPVLNSETSAPAE